jgi:hypothetical protein
MSKSKLVCVDVESDGPYMPDYSIVCFSAIIVEPTISKIFYGKMKPISNNWNSNALAISGFSREEHEKFDDPKEVMENFTEWLKINSGNSPIGISDNNGYDFGVCLNYYFHKFTNHNPFGWSSRRIGDLFCGAEKDLWYKWKKHRITNHSHHPIDDCKGNVEALLYFSEKYGIKLP